MKISAAVSNEPGAHRVVLKTGESESSLTVLPKSEGGGSSANGGELLMLALATCYCNDIYREAGKRGIEVTSVEVTAEATFDREGEAATQIDYSAKIAGKAAREELLALMQHTDSVAEIQNTVRKGVAVSLRSSEATDVSS